MNPSRTTQELRGLSLTQRLARWVWAAFILTFIVARALAILATMDWGPNVHVQLGDTRVHHLNFGIAMLAAIGGYLIFVRPIGRKLLAAAVLYGVGLALTFDEFGMWLHLEDVYWQRASFDAIVVITGMLALLIAAPTLRRFRSRHWATLAGLAVAVTLFGILVVRPFFSQR